MNKSDSKQYQLLSPYCVPTKDYFGRGMLAIHLRHARMTGISNSEIIQNAIAHGCRKIPRNIVRNLGTERS